MPQPGTTSATVSRSASCRSVARRAASAEDKWLTLTMVRNAHGEQSGPGDERCPRNRGARGRGHLSPGARAASPRHGARVRAGSRGRARREPQEVNGLIRPSYAVRGPRVRPAWSRPPLRSTTEPLDTPTPSRRSSDDTSSSRRGTNRSSSRCHMVIDLSPSGDEQSSSSGEPSDAQHERCRSQVVGAAPKPAASLVGQHAPDRTDDRAPCTTSGQVRPARDKSDRHEGGCDPHASVSPSVSRGRHPDQLDRHLEPDRGAG